MTMKSIASLMQKSKQALFSAQALLKIDDGNGASNRAYYAMFDAAQAALLATDIPLTESLGKTHRGLINTFSAHLVKNGPISKELGRQLKRAEEIRLVADYDGSSIEISDAIELVRQADIFISTIEKLIHPQ